MDTPASQVVTADSSRRLLEHLQRIGVAYLPQAAVAPQHVSPRPVLRTDPAHAIPAPHLAPAAAVTSPAAPAAAAAAAEPAVASPSLAAAYPGNELPIQQRHEQLQQLADQVAQCTRCEQLARCRRNTVFGEGNPAARVCFFGEGPGAEEDASGRPFVGRSGELLTKMIEACTFARGDVYILNTVKCRPPGNRNPEPDELTHCRPYFEQQLQIIRPQYVVCLGSVAMQTLLQTTLSIGRMRGRFHRYHDSKVVATYHPAYLLRNPNAKRQAWADLKMLMADMGINPPSR